MMGARGRVGAGLVAIVAALLLSGTGAGAPARSASGPVLVVDPTVLIWNSPGIKSITIRNGGDGNLEFGSMTYPAPASGWIYIAGDCHVASSYPSGTGCTENFQFVGVGCGVCAHVFSLTSNAGSFTVPLLAGPNTVPDLSTTSLGFQDQRQGTTSAPQTVTVTNNSGAAMTLTTFDTTSGAFAATGGTCLGSTPYTIPIGDTCTVEYEFSPPSVGSFTGVFHIGTAFGTRALFMSGNGATTTTPSFSGLSAPTIDFGDSPTTIGGILSANPPPTGTVSITLNGVTHSAALAPDGTFSSSFVTGGLVAGPYPISFSYVGDAQTNAASASSTLVVAQATPSFSGLSSPTIDIGDSPTVLGGTLTSSGPVPTGSVDITLNGVTQSAPLASDGTFSSSFDTSGLAPGSYPVSFGYAGDGPNAAASGSSTLVDSAATASLSGLSAPTITPGTGPTQIGGTVSSTGPAPTGSVEITLAGVPLVAPVASDGSFSASFDTSGLAIGSYPISFAYPGDANTSSATASSTLVVSQATASLVGLSAPTIALGTGPTSIGGTVTSSGVTPTGPVDVTLDGVTQTTAVAADGTFSASFDTAGLDAGAYPITFAYGGDSGTTPASASSTLVVSQATPSLTGLASPTIADGTSPTTLGGTVEGVAGRTPQGSVSITLEGVTRPAPIAADGSFSAAFDTSGLAVGSYTVDYAYAGDVNFTAAGGDTTLTVDLPAAITSPGAATFTVGSPGTAIVTATGAPTPSLSESGPLPSGVTFVDNGNGTATLAGTPAAAGTFTITITAASGAGSPATQTFTLTVQKGTPTVNWTAPATITFGTPLGGAQLDAIASVSGTFGYSPAAGIVLQPGTQTLSVVFTPADSADWNGASVSVTITVGFPQACLTGTLKGQLTVAAGQVVCLGPGARVTGPVSVAAGGVLWASGASITGPLRATGAAALTLCGVSLTGPLTVTGAAGPVELGNSAAGCAGNHITGPVVATGNTGGVAFAGNDVTGPVTITGNSGGFLYAGNSVTGPVRTTGNS